MDPLPQDFRPEPLKLPLFARTVAVPKPPSMGQGTYGVVVQGLEGTGEGQSLLVEVLGHRMVRPMAHIGANLAMRPWAGDLARTLQTGPVLQALGDGEGTTTGVVTMDAEGLQCDPVSWETSSGRFRAVGSDVDLGEAGTQWLGPDAFMALCWLALVESGFGETQRNAKDQALERARFLRMLATKTLPDALDELVDAGLGTPETTSPFARYASRSLLDAGASEVRAIAQDHDLRLVTLSTTGRFWIRTDGAPMDPASWARLLTVEAALNRIAWTAEEAVRRVGDGGLDDRTMDDLGFEFLCTFTDHVAELLSAYEGPNPLRTLHGMTAPQGGGWDLRSRFTVAAERLRLPFRLDYRCDVDGDCRAMAVEFSIPDLQDFPSSRQGSALDDFRTLQHAMRGAYALRLAGLLAAVAFGCGAAVDEVAVVGRSSSLGGPVDIALGFTRARFLAHGGPALDSAELQDLGPWNRDEVLEALDPDEVSEGQAPGHGVQAILDAIAALRPEPAFDDRPLPAALAALLGAPTAQELDVYVDERPDLVEAVRQISEEEAETPFVASLRIQELLEEVADPMAHPPIAGAPQPLYCVNGVARLVVSLVEGVPAPPYQKMLDGVYEAHAKLTMAYARLSDSERALESADACIRCAPTSFSPYFDKAMVAAGAERWDEVTGTLRTVLELALHKDERAFALLRLGHGLQHLDQPREAAACFTTVAGHPVFGTAATHDLQELLAAYGTDRGPDPREALAILDDAHIPYETPERTMALVTEVVMGLVDAGFPEAAWQGVNYLAEEDHSDDLFALAASLRDGTPGGI